MKKQAAHIEPALRDVQRNIKADYYMQMVDRHGARKVIEWLLDLIADLRQPEARQ